MSGPINNAVPGVRIDETARYLLDGKGNKDGQVTPDELAQGFGADLVGVDATGTVVPKAMTQVTLVGTPTAQAAQPAPAEPAPYLEALALAQQHAPRTRISAAGAWQASGYLNNALELTRTPDEALHVARQATTILAKSNPHAYQRAGVERALQLCQTSTEAQRVHDAALVFGLTALAQSATRRAAELPATAPSGQRPSAPEVTHADGNHALNRAIATTSIVSNYLP